MRFLVDSCVPRLTGLFLRELGHDVELVSEAGRDPGDETILALAHANGRLLVTLDNDFGGLVFRKGAEHAGILRLAVQSIEDQQLRLRELFARHSVADLEGNIVTVERHRVRILRVRSTS